MIDDNIAGRLRRRRILVGFSCLLAFVSTAVPAVAQTPAVRSVSVYGSPVSGDTYEFGESIRVQVTFDGPVTVTGRPQVALTIGSHTRQATYDFFNYGDGRLYFDYTVQAADRDADGISIATNSLALNGGTIKAAADGTTDAVLTHDAVAADPDRKVDGSRVTPPAVESVSFNGPASGDTYEFGESIRVQVNFDRAVTVTGRPQVALTIGSHTRQATYIFNDGTGDLYFDYTVQAADRDADGISIATNSLALNGGTIKAAADRTTDAVLTHDAVAADSDHKVDGSRVTPPAVESVFFSRGLASGDTYEFGESIRVQVNFDRAVTVTGTPQVALTIGTQTRHATFTGGGGFGDGRGYLRFSYTVQAADLDMDGISIATNSLALNGGTIKAAADRTTDAVLTHDAVAADSDHKVDGSRVTPPAVESVFFSRGPASGDTYEFGESIRVQVNFDRAVTVTGTPQVTLTIGTQTRHATYIDDGSSAYPRFSYIVQAADLDTDGISIATNSLALNGGTIKAAADGTTDAVLTHDAVAADLDHKVDGSQVTAPKVRFGLGSRETEITYELGDRIVAFAEFDKPVTITGTPQVALTIGSQTRQAIYDSQLSDQYHDLDSYYSSLYFFVYTVQAADRDTDGISIAANALTLNGGTIKAADGTTDAVLTQDEMVAYPYFKVDGSRVTPPKVLGVGAVLLDGRPDGRTYVLGETIYASVGFDRPVTITGTPQVALTIGSHTRQATYDSSVSIFRDRNLVFFKYVVQAADSDTDGISIAANALTLNGGTIKAADGTTDAVLTHDATPIGNIIKVDGSQAATVPTVEGISFANSPDHGDTYERGETIQVSVEFDRSVTVTGTPQVALTIGAHTRQATYSSGDLSFATLYRGTRTLNFSYTVKTGDEDTDGISIAANALALNGGAINNTLAATTAATLTHSSGMAGGSSRKVDGSLVSPPEVIGISFIGFTGSLKDGDTYQSAQLGETISVQVEFDRSVTVTGAPQVALTIGTQTRQATYHAGSGSRYLTFKYAVQEADRYLDRIGIPADALALNGGSIMRAAGGGITAELTHQEVATIRVRDAGDTKPDFGAASVRAQRYVVDSAVAVTLPEAPGGNPPTTYSLTPDPPEGLTFTATTRAITGTPAAPMDRPNTR